MNTNYKPCKWCGKYFPPGEGPFHVIKCPQKTAKPSIPDSFIGCDKSKKKCKKDKSKKKRKKDKSKIKFHKPSSYKQPSYTICDNEEEYHNGTSEHICLYTCLCGKQFGLFDHANSHARSCNYHHKHNKKMDTNFIDDS